RSSELELGERHSLVDRRIMWPVRLGRAGITTRQRTPMLPLSRWPAPIRALVLRIAPSPGLSSRPPPPGCAPATTVSAARTFTARPTVFAALPLAPRPAIAAPTLITPGRAGAVAASCTAPATCRATDWPVRTLRARPRPSAGRDATGAWRGRG